MSDTYQCIPSLQCGLTLFWWGRLGALARSPFHPLQFSAWELWHVDVQPWPRTFDRGFQPGCYIVFSVFAWAGSVVSCGCFAVNEIGVFNLNASLLVTILVHFLISFGDSIAFQ